MDLTTLDPPGPLFEGTVNWAFALEAATEGCVLAPVTSADDLIEIQAVAEGINAWIGVVKPTMEVGTGPGLVTGWKNLDGSEGTTCVAIYYLLFLSALATASL